MLVKQVSVYVENTTGRLAELTHILAEKGIDFRACNIAETVDFGILRFIVPDPQEAQASEGARIHRKRDRGHSRGDRRQAGRT